MADYIDLFPPKAAAAIQSLLPGESWRIARSEGIAPTVTVADWTHVRTAIGTPAALDEAIAPLALPVDAPLPPAWATVLLSTVTLYALAVDFFDTEDQAKRWWNTPLPVSPGGPMYTPKDWTGLPDGAPQVAALIRRTQHGIY